MTPLTDQQTLLRAKNAFGSSSATRLHDLLRLIETLSTNINRTSIAEISAVIEKDAAVLTKLLILANTLGYNPGRIPIGGIAHAIHHVGLSRLRSLSASLMLFEKAGDAHHPPEQRSAATHALCSGLIAQGCATQLGTIDPDLAFACATLRQIGAILLPIVSIEHFRAVIQSSRGKPRETDYKKYFGISPIELSRTILRDIQLPREIQSSLREFRPEATHDVIASRLNTRLLATAEFGNRLAGLALNPQMNSGDFFTAATATAKDFAHILPGAQDLVGASLSHATECIEGFLSTSGIASMSIRSLQRLKHHVHHIEARALPGAAARLNESREKSPVPLDTDDWDMPDILSDEPMETPTGDLHQDSSSDIPASSRIDTVLSHTRDTLGADETWLFRPPPSTASTTFKLAAAHGRDVAGFPRELIVRLGDRSIFGLSLSRREIVLLHNTSDPKIMPYLPGWWHQLENPPRAVALLSVTSGDSTQPCALALLGWSTSRHLSLSHDQVTTMHQLLTNAIESDIPPAA